MADPLPVRAARAGELDRAVDTIALAFAADPFMRWVFPEASDFLEHFRAVLREFGRHAIAHGSVYVAGDFAGAAIWLAPGVHPDETHWYLPMIGVDPSRQSCGVGSALMQHALARSDHEGLHAYLESSNPANLSLYERQGFEILGEIQVADSPVVTPMLRRPR